VCTQRCWLSLRWPLLVLRSSGNGHTCCPIGARFAADQVSADPNSPAFAHKVERGDQVFMYVGQWADDLARRVFTTSYISDRGAGDHTADQSERACPHSHHVLVSGVDSKSNARTPRPWWPSEIPSLVASSTIKGSDRWPDVLQRVTGHIIPQGCSSRNSPGRACVVRSTRRSGLVSSRHTRWGRGQRCSTVVPKNLCS